MGRDVDEQVYRYSAFISYRHVARDQKWARWLIERLETYKTPRQLVKRGVPARIGHIFRDDDEIPASSDLSHQLQDALRVSRFLIVVCSRDTPHSKWVLGEVDFFKNLGRAERIFVLLVDGEPSEAFPPALLSDQQETVAPDGTRKVETVDAEPIAADIRPRADEPKHKTELRAFLRIASGLLGVAYDDLYQRDRQRRLHQQRLRGVVAAMLVLGVATAGYFAWDHYRIKTGYFADLGTRWGVPYGITALSSDATSPRAVRYEVQSQGSFVIHVRRINGSGGLSALDGDGIDGEAWDKGLADWRISFPGAKAAEIGYFDAAGRRLRLERYNWQPDGSAVVAFIGNNGAAKAALAGLSSLSGLPDIDGLIKDTGAKSQIAQNRLVFDSQGQVAQRFYQTVWGAPARASTGAFGTAYAYDVDGHITAFRDIDADGRIMAEKTGVAEIRRTYDKGALTAVAWVDAAGKPALGPGGYHRVVATPDANGNPVGIAFYGGTDEPVFSKDEGAPRLKLTYDAHGNSVRQDILGIHGEPILSPIGVSSIAHAFDAKGRETGFKNMGLDGKPVLDRDKGAAYGVANYDAAGHVVLLAFGGVDKTPVPQKSTGCAGLQLVWDRRGNLTAVGCFDGTSKLTPIKDVGAAIVDMTYDGQDNMTSMTFLDTTNHYVAAIGQGLAGKRTRYDERGNPIEVDYFGIDGKPATMAGTGIARLTRKYDDRGNLVDEEYFGLDGTPTNMTSNGAAGITSQFDDAGNLVAEHFLDGLGRPVLSTDGVAGHLTAYDARGEAVRTSYQDTQGKPAINRLVGAASVTRSYDARGHMIAEAYFGIDGKPVARAWLNFARQTRTYDSEGNQTEEHYFDGTGQPVRRSDIGAAAWTARFDARGNETALIYLDGDGGKMMCADGFAEIDKVFDARDNDIAERFLDAAGKPVMSALGYASARIRYDAQGMPAAVTMLDTAGHEVHPRLAR